MFVLVKRFSHPGEIQVKQKNLLTTLSSVGKEYYVSFEMRIDKNTPGDWTNVLHLTNRDNHGQHGDRIPAIFIFQNNQLHVASSVNGNPNHLYSTWIKHKKWYKLEIQQVYKGGKVAKFLRSQICKFRPFQYHYQVKLDGKLVQNVVNKHPRTFNNVRVYASNHWHAAINGKIKNLVISETGIA